MPTVFHSLMIPSAPEEIMYLPLECIIQERTSLLCPSSMNVCIEFFDFRFHSLIVLSQEADSKYSLSMDKERSLTKSVCPVRV